MKTLILLFALIACAGCKKDYFDSDNASIKNMSNNIVLIQDYNFYDRYDRDTVISEDLSIYETSTRIVKPGDSYFFTYWNKSHKNALSSTDTFSVFILDEGIYNCCPWLDICQNYKVLSRYDLSGDDIIKMRFSIPYPPSPEMKDMKMYPPYEEIIKQGE